MMNWTNNIQDLMSTLKSLSASDSSGQEVEPDKAFTQWRDRTLQLREEGRTVYLVGNGASASMASHTAADLAKNAHVCTEVFTDLSLITAVANDLSYEEVFAEPLRHRMTEGDMAVAISSSGESPNVLLAVREAHNLGGYVVTLTAMRPDSSLRSLGNLNLYTPAETYGMAETCHAAILHYWVDLVVESTEESQYLIEHNIIGKIKQSTTVNT
jgi:D-sedoheptulose 7-phosphate isomerase